MMRLLLASAAAVAAAGGLFLLTDPPVLSLLWNERQVRLDHRDGALVARGEALYATHCAACHGASLEGEPDWRIRGPDGRLPAPPHDETGHTWHHPDAVLFELTKHGLPAEIGGRPYLSNMPAYDGILSDAEIIAVLSYIKSTWPPEIVARQEDLDALAR